jgi:hypothetical protein
MGIWFLPFHIRPIVCVSALYTVPAIHRTVESLTSWIAIRRSGFFYIHVPLSFFSMFSLYSFGPIAPNEISLELSWIAAFLPFCIPIFWSLKSSNDIDLLCFQLRKSGA